MGEIPAGIVVAAILQRSQAINSAGGYLRSLTERQGWKILLGADAECADWRAQARRQRKNEGVRSRRRRLRQRRDLYSSISRTLRTS
jgi:hypothetical protein